METLFIILVILLVFIAIWEYFAGKIIDIAFTGILARRKEMQEKFLMIIFTQLIVWIFFLTLIFITYRTIFEIGSGDLRRVRTYFIIFFILIVFPFAMARKKFVSLVMKTVTSKKNK